MTLGHWLQYRGYDPSSALSVTLGTDGLSPDKHNLLAVSCTGTSPQQDIGTMFISGADPEAPVRGNKTLQDITGVSPDTYYESAMDIVEAQVLVNEAKKKSSFLVIHSAKFTWPWIQGHFPILADVPYIDVMAIRKSADTGISLPCVKTISELQSELGRRTAYIRGGYSFDAICAKTIPNYDGDCPNSYMGEKSPKLMRQVYQLKALYHSLLTMER